MWDPGPRTCSRSARGFCLYTQGLIVRGVPRCSSGIRVLELTLE